MRPAVAAVLAALAQMGMSPPLPPPMPLAIRRVPPPGPGLPPPVSTASVASTHRERDEKARELGRTQRVSRAWDKRLRKAAKRREDARRTATGRVGGGK